LVLRAHLPTGSPPGNPCVLPRFSRCPASVPRASYSHLHQDSGAQSAAAAPFHSPHYPALDWSRVELTLSHTRTPIPTGQIDLASLIILDLHSRPWDASSRRWRGPCRQTTPPRSPPTSLQILVSVTPPPPPLKP
jgi:hypothetical protein